MYDSNHLISTPIATTTRKQTFYVVSCMAFSLLRLFHSLEFCYLFLSLFFQMKIQLCSKKKNIYRYVEVDDLDIV